MSEAQIMDILHQTGELSVNEMTEKVGISRQMVHRYLRSLLEKGSIEKLGRPPRTYYRLAVPQVKEPLPERAQPDESLRFLQEHFLAITETGKRLDGIEAMKFWCIRQRLPVEKTMSEFIRTRKKYLGYFGKNELINGMEKLKNTKAFNGIALDDVFYFDFYAIERFGKTKLGTLLHHAKQGQNIRLSNEIAGLIQSRLHRSIKDMRIEAVGFIPPTIPRHVQFMKVLKQKLNLSLPHIDIKKISGEIVVPQKALSRIEDRIVNAQVSIVVDEKRVFERILLIDDAVGSGATINESARKIKAKGISTYVAGIAVTGSYKGFEVIQEV